MTELDNTVIQSVKLAHAALKETIIISVMDEAMRKKAEKYSLGKIKEYLLYICKHCLALACFILNK